jgi:phenylpropionate dioxygenase-like ring-hydroxylating dioxygenase large terminal subunit
MDILRHYWHPVLRSDEVTDKPAPAKLLDQPLVIWRSNGQVAAFYDLCIHRGTPLSLGWVDTDQLVCAYHGWHYALDGRCVRIPSLSRDRPIPAKARATAFRAEERYGLIWVCLDQPNAEIPNFPPQFDEPSFNWSGYSDEGTWQANAARVLENLADFSHFPWVHEGILGDPHAAECPPLSIEPIDGGFQYAIDSPVNKLNPEGATRQLYQVILPFMLIIQKWQVGGNAHETKIYICSPISAKETKYYRFAGRNFPNRLSDDELNMRHHRIFEQDRRIVESQRPEELPLDLSEELHVRGPDTPALEYRKHLRKRGLEWS